MSTVSTSKANLNMLGALESKIDLVSSQSLDVQKSIDALKNPYVTSDISQYLENNESTLQEKVFDSLAKVKILTSQVSMHISQEKREKLFRQFDFILDSEDWDEEDRLVNVESYQVFLSWFVNSSPNVNPGIGLNDNGNIIASWQVDKSRLILEFFPGKSVKWIISNYINEELERAAGVSNMLRLLDVLSGFNIKRFLYR